MTWRALVEGLAFPEGPAFTPDGTLWWVELEAGALGRRLPDGSLDRTVIGGRPNGLAIDASGRLLVCDQGENALRRYNPATGEITTIVDALDGAPLGKPNDLAFDSEGNLVFTCPNEGRQEPTGYVCCLAPDGALTRIAKGLYFPNGLAFSPNGKHLIVAETYRHRLWRGRWSAMSRAWVDPQPWVEVGGPTGPDGLAFDTDGCLYVAVFGMGHVRIFDGDGTPRGSLDTPGQRPTNVALDPTGRLGLVVTEAEQGRVLSAPSIKPHPSLFPWSTA